MIFEKIVKILVDTKELEDTEITLESTWDELELDSLDTVELLMSIEEEFGINMEMNEKLKTVGDVVEEIKNKIEG